jgi:hypothetical protein
MAKTRRTWKDLSQSQRTAIAVVAVVTGVLQLIMLLDLWRRPADQIRGSKRAWVLASFVRPIGQIAYVGWGRRPAEEM